MKTITLNSFKALELCKILGNVWAINESRAISYLTLLEPHAYYPSDHIKAYKEEREKKSIDMVAVRDRNQDYIRSNRMYDVINRTAIMSFDGPVTKKGTSFGYLFNEYALNDASNMLLMAHADEDVDRIIEDIDSPGGVVGGIVDYIQVINSVNANKPVFTYTNGMLGSAAYWPASATRYIGIGKDADVGSIGVFTYLYDTSDMYKSMGVKAYRFRYPDGKNSVKGEGIPGTKLSKVAQEHIQHQVEVYAKDFINTVAMNRNLSRRDIFNMGGRAYIGEEAVGMGLADGVFTKSEFIEAVSSGSLDTKENKKMFGRGKKKTSAFMAGPEDDEDDEEEISDDEEETTETGEEDSPPQETEETPAEDKELVAYLRGKGINSVSQLQTVFSNADAVNDYRSEMEAETIKQAVRFFGQENIDENDLKKSFKSMSIKILKATRNQYKKAADNIYGIGGNRLTAPSGQHAYSEDVEEKKAEQYKSEAEEIKNRRFGKRIAGNGVK